MARTLDFDARLAELGRRLEGAKEIAGVVAYFHDELVPYPPLMEKSRPGRNSLLEECVTEGLVRALNLHASRTMPKRQFAGAKQVAFALTAFAVPSHGFWHGQAIGAGLIGTFFGFEATSKFCLGISMPDQSAAYLRMTAVPAPLSPAGKAAGTHQCERRPN